MKILFACFHPVDPQVAKNIAGELVRKGYKVLFIVVEKENIINDIIKSYKFPSIVIGSTKKSLLGKILNTILIDVRLFIVVKRFKPTLIFSPASPYTSHISKLLNIPQVCWGDTETATVNLKVSFSLINTLFIPKSFYKEIEPKNKVIRFNGYKEIAYLHPNWFKKNSSILDKLNLKKGDKIILMRFSALKAMHDIGLKSVGDNKKTLLNYIAKLEKFAKVYISMTENDIGEEFAKYRLEIHPSDYIQFLAHCSLYIGEGTTTASEAGVLGVPWINIQSTTRGYLIDQEDNYGLGFRTDDIDLAFNTALKWIQQDNLLKEWKLKSERLLNDKIDLSAFLIWFIENYPESHEIMKDNPEYQTRFR